MSKAFTSITAKVSKCEKPDILTLIRVLGVLGFGRKLALPKRGRASRALLPKRVPGYGVRPRVVHILLLQKLCVGRRNARDIEPDTAELVERDRAFAAVRESLRTRLHIISPLVIK